MGMGAIDFAKVNVRSRGGAGDQDACSCATPSYNAIKWTAGSPIEVSYGCKTRAID